MTKAALFLISTIIASPAFAQATFEFKGVALRSSEAELVQAHPGFECRAGSGGFARECVLYRLAACTSGTIGSATCQAAESYGGEPFEQVHASFIDGVGLASVLVILPSRGFERVAAALRDKHGATSEQLVEKVKTKAGVEYQNPRLVWKAGRDELVARRFVVDITRSTVQLVTPEALKVIGASQREERRAASKNL